MHTLYLCATPIGNLEDITVRTLRVLGEVSLVICEDTRHTRHLLEHYDLHKPLRAYHDHNKEVAEEAILDHLENVGDVALLTDAGMPGISDPGYELVNACRARGIPYTVLPGASASLTALVFSGMASDRFCFEGFLPRKGKERQTRLNVLVEEPRTAILYEAPHRLRETLADLSARFPERELAACRELSKRYEEVVRGSVAEVVAHYETEDPRGEYVLILAGASPTESTATFTEAVVYAARLKAGGMKTKAAAKHTAEHFPAYKSRDIYRALLDEA